MDPMELVTAAVIGAARAVGSAPVSALINDAYSKLKALLFRKSGTKSDLESTLNLLPKAPDSADLKTILEREIKSSGADKEREVIDFAQEVLRLLKQEGYLSESSYRAVLSGSGAIAQGAGAVAVGKGGVAVTGNVQGGINVTRREENDE
jgi:hypothetical protein